MYPKTSIAGITACMVTMLTATLPCELKARETAGLAAPANNQQVLFIENNGQIVDQHRHPRKDIDFGLTGSAINVFIGGGQVHYQWAKAETDISSAIHEQLLKPGQQAANSNISFYRLDAVLAGANVNAQVITEEKQPYYENYYLAQCPQGITAHSYRKITYKDIYPDIDWVLYIKGSQLEYDFVVHEGGKVNDIKIRYEGASSLGLSEGRLMITTPYGTVTENKPYSYDAATGREIPSAFVLQGNMLSFDVEHTGGEIVIDPTIGWGTYYGIPSTTRGLDVAADANGSAYLAGSTENTGTLSTFGAHQVNHGGDRDGYIVKLAKGGMLRDWATYYGGSAADDINTIVCNKNNNLYIGGGTSSTTDIASTSSHQGSNGGSSDGFVAMFNSAGVRQWGTYYGGSGTDVVNAVAVDNSGNVFIAGNTSSTNGTSIATSGAYQTTAAKGFFAKFSASGARQWGTYYGFNTGNNTFIDAAACDSAGNVYIAGSTDAQAQITSTGSHQSGYGGGAYDGFVVKFSGSGARQWGSYYGGSGIDFIRGISCDRFENLYITGYTNSTSGIASTGTHQSGISGGNDGFLARINATTCQRIWGTYIGGTGDEIVHDVYAGADRAIYISGGSNSTSGIATAGNHQTVYGGNNAIQAGEGDGFLAKFGFTGLREWGTYYGGDSDEYYMKVAYGGGKLYVGGTTNSPDAIATANGFLNFLSGTPPPTPPSPFPWTAFCAQFEADTAVYFDQVFTDTTTCHADTLYIKYNVTNDYRAGNVFTLQLSDATGSFANPINITSVTSGSGGIFKYWMSDTLTPSANYRIRIVASAFPDTSWDNARNIRVTAYPELIPIAIAPVCANGKLQLRDNNLGTPSTTYLWEGPSSFSIAQKDYDRPNVQITDTGWYYLTAKDYGCESKDSVHVMIYAKPDKPVLQSNSPVCATDTLKVWATTTSPNVDYWIWSKPSGFVPNTPNADTIIPSAALTDSGRYIVAAVKGGCISDEDTVFVEVGSKTAPTIQITANGINPVPGPWVGVQFFITGSSNGGTNPTYQWTKNGTNIPGATASTYNTTTGSDLQNGDTICVIMTSSAHCPIPNTAKSCIGVPVDMGVKNIDPVGFIGLHPNPNNGIFTLSGKALTNERIMLEVINITGQVVFTDAVIPSNKQVHKQMNISNLPQGVYLLQMKTANGMSTARFTVNK